jgi:hypothetical protein
MLADLAARDGRVYRVFQPTLTWNHKMTSNSENNSSARLVDKVKAWFESEGYPLEFDTSRVFKEQGFSTLQGYYISDETNGQPREVDVLADIDLRLDDYKFIRARQVVECKWSRDKPWVIFTSRQSTMAESACIAQTIGSRLAEAAMFCEAGNSHLYEMDTFKSPQRGGFAGHRAFEKEGDNKQDQFYRAVQGVVNAAVALARRHDASSHNELTIPDHCFLLFPIIVVEGSLFEAYYDDKAAAISLAEVDNLRLFWRGSKANRRPITVVDVVTAKAAAAFARNRAGDMKALLAHVKLAIDRIRTAHNEHNFEKLEIKPASRGFTGLPPLLAELYALAQSAKKPLGLNQSKATNNEG